MYTVEPPITDPESEKRTTSLQRTLSVLRIEFTIRVILKQPPRSGRFSIPDSRQRTKSALPTALYNAELPLNSGHQETTPLKLYIHTVPPAHHAYAFVHRITVNHAHTRLSCMARHTTLCKYLHKSRWSQGVYQFFHLAYVWLESVERL